MAVHLSRTRHLHLALAASFLLVSAGGATSRPAVRGVPARAAAFPEGAAPFLAMAGAADAVVTATLISKRSYWNAGHTLILTDFTLRTSSVISGDAPASMILTGEGGEVGEIGLSVSGEIAFEPGATYALFLTHAPTGLSVLRAGQGMWRLDDSGPARDAMLHAIRATLATGKGSPTR